MRRPHPAIRTKDLRRASCSPPSVLPGQSEHRVRTVPQVDGPGVPGTTRTGHRAREPQPRIATHVERNADGQVRASHDATEEHDLTFSGPECGRRHSDPFSLTQNVRSENVSPAD